MHNVGRDQHQQLGDSVIRMIITLALLLGGGQWLGVVGTKSAIIAALQYPCTSPYNFSSQFASSTFTDWTATSSYQYTIAQNSSVHPPNATYSMAVSNTTY